MIQTIPNLTTGEAELMQEIALAMADYFNCRAVCEGNRALLRFEGGGAYVLTVSELPSSKSDDIKTNPV